MHSRNHVFRRLLAVAAMGTLMAWSDIALSQSKNRQVGTQYTDDRRPASAAAEFATLRRAAVHEFSVRVLFRHRPEL
jgi:hypothetical protein